MFKVSTKELNKEQILYLLVLEIDNKQVCKIGITSRNIEDRVVEILASHFIAYRFFPYCRPKRFKKIANTYEKEQELLEYFKEYKYVPECSFGGSTELVSDISLDVLVSVYEDTYKGIELNKESHGICTVCGKEKKFRWVDEDTEEESFVCGNKCGHDSH